MIVAVSIDRDFDDYAKFSDTLQNIESSNTAVEFCSIGKPELLLRYKEEFGSNVNVFEIFWKVNSETLKKDIKQGKFGPYDSGAPLAAARRVAGYCTHFINFGNGDYNISRECLNLERPEITFSSQETSKRYKF